MDKRKVKRIYLRCPIHGVVSWYPVGKKDVKTHCHYYQCGKELISDY